MADNQITPFQLTDQFTMDNFNQRINETNIALQKKADTSVIDQIENDVNVLESRMNEFTSLPQGSTSGDAELADIRVGQDGTVYGTAGNAVRAQVNQLKQDLGELNALLVNEETIVKDITNDLTWNQGYMANNGTVDSSVSSMHYTNKIEVREGDVLATGNINHKPRYITAFSGNTVIVEKGDNTGDVQSYSVPSGIDSVVFTFYTSLNNLQINHTFVAKKSKADDSITELTNNIEQIESNISHVVNVEEYTEYANEENTPIYTVGWCNPNTGTHVAEYETIFEHTQRIPVSEGDVVTAKNAQGATNIAFRWVACFNGYIVVPSAGSSTENVGFTVPSGVTHIVPTLRISSNATVIVVSGVRESKAYNIKTTPLGYTRTSGSLSNGQTLSLPYHNVKNHNVIVFSSNITSFDSLKIGKQTNTFVTIDNTNVSVTCDSSSQNFSVAHGLTIQNNIQVIIENETSIRPSRIRVLSCGNEFEAKIPNNARFLMDEGSHYVTSINSTLTDCAFSWTSRHINKPIWLFGDSYFTWYPERWTYYLARDGFTDSCMLNGFAGENSAGAYPALENLLKVHTPKMVVWCQGMNDPDNNDSVNESWKSYYDKVVSLSKKYGFELVLYTIPTTPTMNNRFKNDIVRNSGYRYVEADKSLRIDDDGNWIEGTLDDNVHPTIKGAKLLYHRFLADIPELTSKC